MMLCSILSRENSAVPRLPMIILVHITILPINTSLVCFSYYLCCDNFLALLAAYGATSIYYVTLVSLSIE